MHNTKVFFLLLLWLLSSCSESDNDNSPTGGDTTTLTGGISGTATSGTGGIATGGTSGNLQPSADASIATTDGATENAGSGGTVINDSGTDSGNFSFDSATVDAALPDAALSDAALPGDSSMTDAANIETSVLADASSPTGTFPAVTDVKVDGPYTPTTITNTGPNNGYTVFHPAELAPDGLLNPIVTWGNGGFTTPDTYPQLPHLASHGFVVVASNNPFVTGPDVKAGLDWIIQQNDDSSSPFYQKLDVSNVSGMGYSFGGLATMSVADDPRYVTIVIVSGASTDASSRSTNVPKYHTPVAYFCTDDDASENNCRGDYDVVTVPVFFGVVKGSEHVNVTTFLGLGNDAVITQLSGAITAWLRWFQMDDQSQSSMFMNADCGLCTDANWAVEPQKNWPTSP